MIFELIFNVLFGIPNMLFNLFPNYDYQNLSGLGETFQNFLSIGLYFCGVMPFSLIIGNVVVWAGGGLIFNIVDWIYDKIPFKAT